MVDAFQREGHLPAGLIIVLTATDCVDAREGD